jgi:HEAT repeat protein
LEKIMNTRIASVKFPLLGAAVAVALVACLVVPAWAGRGGGSTGDVRPTPPGQQLIGASLATGTPWAETFEQLPRDLGGIYVGLDPEEMAPTLQKVLAGGKANFTALLGMCVDSEKIQPNKLEDYKVRWLLHVSIVAAAKQTDSKDRAAAVDALLTYLAKPDLPKTLQALAIQELQWAGTAEQAPKLAQYLTDEWLYAFALRALESYGPEALPTVRAALATTKGRPHMAIIQTLGMLRDSKSVDAIKPDLAAADRDMRIAAMDALANIGDASSGDAMLKAVEKTENWEHTRACDDCLQLAKRLAEAGDSVGATKVYSVLAAKVANIETDKHVQMAATQGQALAGGDTTALLNALKSQDLQVREAAMQALTTMPGAAATKTVVTLLAQASTPSEKNRFLSILGSRKDATALPAVLPLLKDTDESVKSNAASTVSVIGGPQATTALVGMLGSTNAKDQQIAADALKNVTGKDVDAAVAALYPKATDAGLRTSLLSILAAHRATEQMPVVVTAMSDKEASVRLAAIKAYGAMAGEKDLAPLVKILSTSKDGAEVAAAEEALKSAAARQMADKVTAVVAPAVKDAAPANAAAMVRVLSATGGADALAAVVTASKSTAAEVKEAAIRAMADWRTKDAATPLLAAAQTVDNQTLKVIALRGAIRLSRDKAISAAERVTILTAAMKLAPGTGEKREVLSALQAVPDAAGLALAVPCLDDDGTREEAALAIVKIAETVVKTSPAAVRDPLTKVIAATKNNGTKNNAQRILDQIK